MMNETIDLTISVVNTNNRALLEGCLASIHQDMDGIGFGVANVSPA